MSRKLASIQVVTDIQPIEGADNIEKCKVLGWQVVIGKNQFKDGEKVVYIETDAVLPEDDEDFAVARKYAPKKVKIAKLRGTISQGLVMPLSILGGEVKEEDGRTYVKSSLFTGDEKWNPYEVGEDVSEWLGIYKYDPPIPVEMGGEVKGDFPAVLKKTDETRIQNVPGFLERHKGKQVYTAEKLDGTSMSVYFLNGEMGVCGRNWDFTEGNLYWRVANSYKLKEKLKEAMADDILLQGELIGPGIQGNKYNLTTHEFRLFNVFNPTRQTYYNFEDMLGVAELLGLTTVPILATFDLNHTVDELLEMATIRSTLNPKAWAEGIVLRTLVDEPDEETGRTSIKIISPTFLLKHVDED